VIVTGSSFTGATGVKVGDAAVAYQVLSDTKLQVTVPAKTVGSYVVTVTTASGTSTQTTKYIARA